MTSEDGRVTSLSSVSRSLDTGRAVPVNLKHSTVLSVRAPDSPGELAVRGKAVFANLSCKQNSLGD